jgi:hypothetical protein
MATKLARLYLGSKTPFSAERPTLLWRTKKKSEILYSWDLAAHRSEQANQAGFKIKLLKKIRRLKKL